MDEVEFDCCSRFPREMCHQLAGANAVFRVSFSTAEVLPFYSRRRVPSNDRTAGTGHARPARRGGAPSRPLDAADSKVVSSPGRCLALPAQRPAHGIRIYHQVSNYWGAQPSFKFSPSLNTHSGCPCLLQRAIRKFVLCPKFSCARRSSYEKDQTSAHLKGTHGIQSTASFERRERGARRNSIIFRPMSARAGVWASVSLIRASGHCIPIHDVGLAALSEDKSSGASVRLHAIAVRSGDSICKGAMIVRTALGGMPRTLR
jgi:hypothetical protein